MGQAASNSGELVLVVGAGFSRPAGGPLLREILSVDTPVGGRNTLRKWVQQSSPTTIPDIEERFSDLWARRAFGGNVEVDGKSVEADFLVDVLQNHLSHMCKSIRFGRRPVAAYYERFLDEITDHYDLVTILSFNYDLLVEDMLDSMGIGWDYGTHPDIQFFDDDKQKEVEKDAPSVQILKLHGSANWGECRGCLQTEKADSVITAFNAPYSNQLRSKKCAFCGKVLRVGIVPPIYGKAGQVEFIQYAWREARERLVAAQDLMVIGYSLPKSDLEANLLLGSVKQNRALRRARLVTGPQADLSRYQVCIPQITDSRSYFEEYLEERFSGGI